jgi:hypothetical protein
MQHSVSNLVRASFQVNTRNQCSLLQAASYVRIARILGLVTIGSRTAIVWQLVVS